MGLLSWLFGDGGITTSTRLNKSTVQADSSIQASDADVTQLEDSLLTNSVDSYQHLTAGDDISQGNYSFSRDDDIFFGADSTIGDVTSTQTYEFFSDNVKEVIDNMIDTVRDLTTKNLQLNTEKDLLESAPVYDSVFESSSVENSNSLIIAVVVVIALVVVFIRWPRKGKK